jgi:hypothetical protein
VNWDVGTADYTVTFGTVSGSNFYTIGSSGPVNVTFNGASSYIGDNLGVYLSSFQTNSGSSVPAGNIALRISVAAHGIYWPVMDNLRLEIGNVAPVITTQPVSQILVPGSTITFTVAGTDIVSYQWYKNSTALSDGANISGTATRTLTITNAQSADEGQYFCRVSNEMSIDSAAATLSLKKLVAHWTFDGNLLDSSGLANHGTAVGKMTYMTGADNAANGALFLDNLAGGQAENYVKIINPVWSRDIPNADLISYCGSFTLTLWVRPSFLQAYEMYVSTGIQPNGGWYCGRYGSDPNVTLLINPVQNGFSAGPINDGSWHFLTAVVDVSAGTLSLYVDSRLKAQKSALPTGGVDFLIGALNWKANRNAADNISLGYTGLLDDVRIYNYPLSQNEINGLFNGIVEHAVCNEIIFGDINQDCVVNLADFAVITANWMICNLVPASACT